MLVPWREGEEHEEEVVQLHHWNIVPKATKAKCCPPEIESVPSIKRDSIIDTKCITWTVSDIAKAACLLSSPPISTDFEDEQEMRRVYTLIYDTFRYKSILNQALNDISFYQLYPDLPDLYTRIWLLFYDLYHRSFRKREPAVVQTAKTLFAKVGLTPIEDALWRQRTKLAAAVSRLRIQHSALQLSELLPKHLRDERVSYQGKTSPLTCWINPNKIKNDDEIIKELKKMFNLKLVNKAKTLTPDCYQWDRLCPNFLAFHHSLRAVLARSVLVQKHKLIVQDRSFCLGPAAFGKIVFDLELAGTVIQSHVNSPRSTAYLATLLMRNSKIKNLLVFGAGNRKGEYESYFQDLGMTNVTIYSDKLIDIPPDSNCLDRVIAVFATPPNSYSAVSDPIDLVCSRGGDLSMLEVLTESEVTSEGKERVASILEEQRKTLRFAMSRPQIQLVLYETHSELDIENETMVQKTIKEMNKLAKLKHAALQGKIRMNSANSEIILQDTAEINNNETIKVEIMPNESMASSATKRLSVVSKASAESLGPFEKIYKDVVVPNCDLFDQPNLPDLCPNQDSCFKLCEEGCYLALLQRKEVTRLDNKYMIQMAEVRGLFGSNSSTSGRTKGSRGSKNKKQDKRPASPPPVKTKRKSKGPEIDRIAAPTLASLRHHTNYNELQECPKNRSLEQILHVLENIAKKKSDLTKEWDDPTESAWLDSVETDTTVNLGASTSDSPSEDSKLKANPNLVNLGPLKMLLDSESELKSIISSRLPYRGKHQSTSKPCWNFYPEMNNDDNRSQTTSSVRPKTTIDRSRSKKRELTPEALEKIAAPTHSSRTRSEMRANVQLPVASREPGRKFTCVKCIKRNQQ